MSGWRFFSHELDLWCDGVPRELREGVDYPAGTSYESINNRLRVAASRRGCSCRVWQHEGAIRFVMVSCAQGTARVLRAGE